MALKSAEKIRHAQSLRVKLIEEQKDVRRQISELTTKQTTITKRIEKLTKEIESHKEKELIVSEHAVYRYFERVVGINMDEIKSKILTEDNKLLVENLGNGKYPLEKTGKNKIIVRDRTVVSVI